MSATKLIISVSALLDLLEERNQHRTKDVETLRTSGDEEAAEVEEARKLIYRGQSKRASDPVYRLIPSVGRMECSKKLTSEKFKKLEVLAHDIFRKQIVANPEPRPRNMWEVLSLAQHHSLPTRFMDWTSNPLVALYFATRKPEHDKTDGAIYILTQPTISFEELLDETHATSKNEMEKVTGRKKKRDEIEVRHIKQLLKTEEVSPFEITQNVIYDPPHVSPRIRAQDGLLLAFHNPAKELPPTHYVEFVIPGRYKDKIRRELEQYGVFDKQLFPDLDGLARWLKFKVFDSFENGVSK